MTNKWLLGTAMATLIATGAVAQDRDLSAADPCRFETIAAADDFAAAMAELDSNADERISREEYLECLVRHGVELDEEQQAAFMDEFDALDSDGDAYVVLADIEDMQTASRPDDAAQRQTGDGTDVAVEQQSAKITVTQPAARVTVREGQAEVTVTQAEPQVEVRQRQPEVAVEQHPPEVSVQQSEVQVAVEQPEPTVRVEQPEPQVRVTQSQPEVAVREGRPRVEVETEPPEVRVAQPEPEVSVSQPQPEVEVRTEQPEVRVEDAQADVEVERTSDVDVAARTGDGSARVAEDTTARRVATEAISYEELEGRDVYNLDGEEIGEIEAVRFDPQTERPVVIIEVGGFLGLGKTELVFGYDELTITEDRIVLDTVLSEDELEERGEYDEARYQDLPAEMTRR